MPNIWEIFNISGVAACVIFIFSAARFLYFFLPASSEDASQAFLPAYSCNIQYPDKILSLLFIC